MKQVGVRLRRSHWLLAVLVFAGGLAALVPWLGRPLVEREQELRVVLTARDMASGGSWLIPHYLGEPRLNKPPLMYWVTAGVFKLAGTTQSPALARLPAAVFAALLVSGIFWFGSFLVGRRRALLGSMVAGTCYLFLSFGRLAETDIPLGCLESLSVWMLFMAARRWHSWGWWLGSGLAAGLAFMIKGPAALVLPLGTLLTYWALSPPADRGGLRWRRVMTWIALAILLALPWYLLVFRSPASGAASADIGYEVGALLKHSAHQGSPLFYLYQLPVALLPWGLLLPFAIVAFWRMGRRRAGIRFLLAWLLSSLVLMSIVKSKQIHYATLLLAPSAVLIGCLLRSVFSNRASWRRGIARGYAVACTTVACLIGVACMFLPRFFPMLSIPVCLLFGAAIAGIALGGLWAMARSRPTWLFAWGSLAIILAGIVVAGELDEIRGPSRIVKQCAMEAESRVAPGGRVFLAGRRLL